MRVLVMGGTEFISLHLLQALQRRGPRGHRFQPRPPSRSAARRRGHHHRRPEGSRRAPATPRRHALGRGLRRHLRADPAGGRGRAGGRLPGSPHVVFVSTCRVYDHALAIPYSEETPRSFYWGDYARHKIGGEDVLFERHRTRGLPVTIVRPTHVMGPLNTRNNETFFMDRISRGRPVLVPGARRLAAAVRPRRGPGRGHGRPARRLAGVRAGLQRDGRRRGEPGRLRRADRRGHRPAGHAAALRRRPAQELRQAGPVFGQNLVYDCHAVHTTTKLRNELGLRPRYTLHAGLAQTWDWYRAQGLAERAVDFSFEDRLLAKIGA